MPQISRKHFIEAVEAGIAACPALQDPKAASALRSLRDHCKYQCFTLIGAFATNDAECPLVYARLLEYEVDDRSLFSRYVDSIDGGVLSYADFAPFWQAFDGAAGPHVVDPSDDCGVPVEIIP